MELQGYSIVKELRQGPISTVFLGKQLSLDRPVLIKRLNTQWMGEEDLLERFRREAAICARLKHPNIVNIIDVRTQPDNLYLVIEYIEGLNLAEVIRKYHPIPFDIIIFITREILRGLAYAHARGVIHRDVKPTNILIGRDGAVKIADFGLATMAELPDISASGEVVGTPAYMSPEQARVSPLDHRSDLFSLGITLYELAGEPSPFRGQNIVASIQKLLGDTPPPLRERRSDIPAWFSDLVERLLSKKASHRPVSADRLLEMEEFRDLPGGAKELAAFLKPPPDVIPRAELSTSPASQKPKRSAIAGLAALSILGILLLLWAARYQDSRPAPDGKDLPRKIAVSQDSLSPETPGEKGKLIALPRREMEDRSEKATASAAAPSATSPRSSGHNAAAELSPGPAEGEGASNRIENPTPAARQLDTSAVTPSSEPPVQPARLFIQCSPWADIYINGEKRETTPLLEPLVLPPGDYLLELRNPSYAIHRRQLKLRPGESDSLTINLQDRRGYLNLQVTPWAQVYIDGRYYETTPLKRPIVLAAGTYQLALKNPGYRSWEDSIEIFPQEIISKRVVLDKE